MCKLPNCKTSGCRTHICRNCSKTDTHRYNHCFFNGSEVHKCTAICELACSDTLNCGNCDAGTPHVCMTCLAMNEHLQRDCPKNTAGKRRKSRSVEEKLDIAPRRASVTFAPKTLTSDARITSYSKTKTNPSIVKIEPTDFNPRIVRRWERVGIILINKAGKVLMQKRNDRIQCSIALPGGSLDEKDSSSWVGAKRELHEESDVLAESRQCVGYVARPKSINFVCHYTGPNQWDNNGSGRYECGVFPAGIGEPATRGHAWMSYEEIQNSEDIHGGIKSIIKEGYFKAIVITF